MPYRLLLISTGNIDNARLLRLFEDNLDPTEALERTTLSTSANAR